MTTDNERKTASDKTKPKSTKSTSAKLGRVGMRIRSTRGKSDGIQRIRVEVGSRQKKAELEARKELYVADASARGMANWLNGEAFAIACETQQLHERALATEQQFKELSEGLGVLSGRQS